MAINLNKITLEKQGDSHKIDLTKGNELLQEIVINLNWTQEPPKKGFWSTLLKGNSAIDLDLGCFYCLNNGQKSVIDGLQFAHGQGGPKDAPTKQGRYTGAPWIWHTGDDRSGAGNGENILVNPKGLTDLKRIVVYCFIYEGAAKWTETNAVVTVKIPNNPEIAVEMGKQYSTRNFCAIAEILFDKNNSITVKKLVSFHTGHGDCDKAYNWGMKWTAGSK
ncbi:MAG: TerD family protein [Prevotellaceae bacterium]|jgi:tellurite resistance protein TerA|nr:TerD family protein [Prevotellaceae bacterium]